MQLSLHDDFDMLNLSFCINLNLDYLNNIYLHIFQEVIIHDIMCKKYKTL